MVWRDLSEEKFASSPSALKQKRYTVPIGIQVINKVQKENQIYWKWIAS